MFVEGGSWFKDQEFGFEKYYDDLSEKSYGTTQCTDGIISLAFADFSILFFVSRNRIIVRSPYKL